MTAMVSHSIGLISRRRKRRRVKSASMRRQMFALTGTPARPQSPERALALAILGLTVLSLGGSASVLLWGLALLR